MFRTRLLLASTLLLLAIGCATTKEPPSPWQGGYYYFDPFRYFTLQIGEGEELDAVVFSSVVQSSGLSVEGTGEVVARGEKDLRFRWEDAEGNEGSATLRLVSAGVALEMEVESIENPRVLELYAGLVLAPKRSVELERGMSSGPVPEHMR
ncbi:MAG: hypothetical protein ACC661_06745 [Verrucomicrobiales bacterium]